MAIGDKARFKALLDGYNGIQPANGQGLCQLAERLLDGFKEQHKQGRKLQETTADDFNLLETLQISSDESRHSMMLAWLLGRACWPSKYRRRWPSGFYIYSISLDSFCLPESEAPGANIWIGPPKGKRIDLDPLRESIRRQARQQLKVELRGESKSELDLSFDLPESRDALLDMLTKKMDRNLQTVWYRTLENLQN